MEIKFNRTGKERKALVMAIAQITGTEAVYKGVPTCNYEAGHFTIDRNGTLSFNDVVSREELKNLLERLAQKGFAAEPGDNTVETDETPHSENPGLTVAIPIDKVNVHNLTTLIEIKGSLIRAALGVDRLPVEADEDKVSFPWFSELPDAETAKAYTHFITALCEMSVNQKRRNAARQEGDNQKYAFRCWLLRLGFIGPEYKTERKILLKNLSGSSAFKNGVRKEAAGNEISGERDSREDTQ